MLILKSPAWRARLQRACRKRLFAAGLLLRGACSLRRTHGCSDLVREVWARSEPRSRSGRLGEFAAADTTGCGRLLFAFSASPAFFLPFASLAAPAPQSAKNQSYLTWREAREPYISDATLRRGTLL